MTKITKKVVLMILSICLLFTCCAVSLISVSANSDPYADDMFWVTENSSDVTPIGASIRLNNPTGLRFESTIGKVDGSATYGYVIVPEYYLIENNIFSNYIPQLIDIYGEDGIIYLESVPVQYGDAYYIKGSVSKILYNNMNITYAGIPYKMVNSTYYYSVTPYITSNVLDIATAALNDYYYYGNEAEYYDDQLEIINNFLNSALNRMAGVSELENETTIANKTLEIEQTKEIKLKNSASISVNTVFNTDLIVWESNNPSVATVENGVVTAKASGTAIITAKVAGVSATCEVTVPVEYLGSFDNSDYINLVSLNTPSTKAVGQNIQSVSVLDSVTLGGITEYGVLKVDIYAGSEGGNNINEQVNLVVGLMNSYTSSGYTVRWAINHPTFSSNIGSIRFANADYATSGDYANDVYVNFQGDTMVEMNKWQTTYVGGDVIATSGVTGADAIYMQFHGQGPAPDYTMTAGNYFTVYFARVSDGEKSLSTDSPSDDIDVSNRPTYSYVKDMPVMAYVAPRFDEMLIDYKAAGFNMYILSEDYGYMNDTYVAAFNNCKNQGIDVLIRSFDQHYIESAYPYYGTSNLFFNSLNFNIDNYDVVKGVYMWDEPSTSAFNEISTKIVPWWNENYADTETFIINLFPSYAGSSLGVSQSEYVNGSAFEGYVAKYVNEVLSKVNGHKTLSCDHYPLNSSNGVDSLSTDYLYDLAVVSTAAHALENCTYTSYIQAYGSGGLKLPDSKEDISLQIYTSLAFGAKHLDFYRYVSGDSETGIVNGGFYTDSTKNDIYYHVKDALTDLHFLDDVYMHFDWKGIKTYLGTNSASNAAFSKMSRFAMTSVPGISAFTSSQDSLLGYYTDAQNRKGYLAVNYTVPSQGKTDVVNMTFDGNYTKALVYIEGVAYTYNVVDNKLNLTLNPGQGAFVIPY